MNSRTGSSELRHDSRLQGLLFIGDPHLEARIPGFRKDDYPQVALEKFRWCLNFARDNGLQPILLGDLFQLPQDNPNWLLNAIIETIDGSIGQPLPAIYGNHDVRENSLKPNDSIQILFTGGHLARLSIDEPWMNAVGGRAVTVGGSAWGEKLPGKLAFDSDEPELSVWITHHDILIPGYEESGRIRPREIPGIDLVVNGHVHRRLPPVSKGGTHWITAGNIVRRTRSDASRDHLPAVLQLTPVDTTTELGMSGATLVFRSRRDQCWKLEWIPVPHRPFDEVFHPEVAVGTGEQPQASGFVADLRELTARRTDSGAGLGEFLKQHIDEFAPPVAAEILRLAKQVSRTDN